MGTTETCQTPIYGLASRVVLRGSKWKPHCGYFRRLNLCPANAHTSSAAASAKHATPHHEKPPVQPVPLHLRDSHTSLNRKLGNGADYIYPHDCPNHISGQEYMPRPAQIYRPTDYGAEKQVAERLDFYKKLKKEIQNAGNKRRK